MLFTLILGSCLEYILILLHEKIEDRANEKLNNNEGHKMLAHMLMIV